MRAGVGVAGRGAGFRLLFLLLGLTCWGCKDWARDRGREECGGFKGEGREERDGEGGYIPETLAEDNVSSSDFLMNPCVALHYEHKDSNPLDLCMHT